MGTEGRRRGRQQLLCGGSADQHHQRGRHRRAGRLATDVVLAMFAMPRAFMAHVGVIQPRMMHAGVIHAGAMAFMGSRCGRRIEHGAGCIHDLHASVALHGDAEAQQANHE